MQSAEEIPRNLRQIDDGAFKWRSHVRLRRLRSGSYRSGMNQLILRSAQFSDPDRMTPKHVGRDVGWIIAGTENDDLGIGELLQQALKIAVGRDQDEALLSKLA